MNETILIAVVAILAVFVIASLIIGVTNVSKINSILDYSEDGDLVTNLERYYNNIRDLQKKLNMSQSGAIIERISSSERKTNKSLSKTGIVHFDAFDDVHGKQSFAAAVLNQHNTGFVLTSLYGNNSSNVYIREIKEGKCSIPLLEEEQEAVDTAMSSDIPKSE